ncbi:MAG: ABC transporter ATP-binding protein [Actinobacteria bacterium]|nr:MAG: ABC transporter ATP-binding protein [Actinomycetota bacterium]
MREELLALVLVEIHWPRASLLSLPTPLPPDVQTLPLDVPSEHELEQGETRNETPYVVETSGLTKRFGDREVVKDVELHVPRGSAFGYLGPNGAGKTTLIRMLFGLTPANAGSMRLLGLPPAECRAEALRRVGAIVEEPSFSRPPERTREPARRRRGSRAGGARARSVRSRDGRVERPGRRSSQDLLHGHATAPRRRPRPARRSEPLILDEPANGLDPAGILEFRGLVCRLVDEGRTVMLSSHLLDEVEKTCDGVAIVDRGRIVAQGTIAELRDGGGTHLLIEAEPIEHARTLLASSEAVSEVTDEGGSLRARLTDPAAVSELNRRLVEAGIAVRRLEPVQASLEQRFLEITSRFEEAA